MSNSNAFVPITIAATAMLSTTACTKTNHGTTPTPVQDTTNYVHGHACGLYLGDANQDPNGTQTVLDAIDTYPNGVIVEPSYYPTNVPANAIALLNMTGVNTTSNTYQHDHLLPRLPADPYVHDGTDTVTYNKTKILDYRKPGVRQAMKDYVLEAAAKFPGGVCLGGFENATAIDNAGDYPGLMDSIGSCFAEICASLPGGKVIAADFLFESTKGHDLLPIIAQATNHIVVDIYPPTGTTNLDTAFEHERLKQFAIAGNRDFTNTVAATRCCGQLDSNSFWLIFDGLACAENAPAPPF